MSEGQCISHTPPTCASAASAWGSQKVMSIARYSAMAAVSQHGPAPAGRSWHTVCRGQGDSGPGAGACRVRRPGQGPDGSGLQPARPPGARDVSQCRRGGAGHTPDSHGAGGHGRAPALARRGAWRPRRPASICASPSERLQSDLHRLLFSLQPCCIASVSSGTASATRPAKVYAIRERRSDPGEPDQTIRVLTDAYGPFEQGKRPGEVTRGRDNTPAPLAAMQAPRVLHRLSNPRPFLDGPGLGQLACHQHQRALRCTDARRRRPFTLRSPSSMRLSKLMRIHKTDRQAR